MSAAAALPLDAHPINGARDGRSSVSHRLLGICLGLSLLLHGALLSLQVRAPEMPPAKDPGLEVVLVNARHARAPQDAQVLAQASLEGGGSSEQKVRPSSPLPPQEASKHGNALVEARRRQPQEVQRPKQQVLTQPKSTATVASEPPQRKVAKGATKPETRPRLLADTLSDARWLVTTRSLARTNANPLPMATPSTAATIGLGN